MKEGGRGEGGSREPSNFCESSTEWPPPVARHTRHTYVSALQNAAADMYAFSQVVHKYICLNLRQYIKRPKGGVSRTRYIATSAKKNLGSSLEAVYCKWLQLPDACPDFKV